MRDQNEILWKEIRILIDDLMVKETIIMVKTNKIVIGTIVISIGKSIDS